MGTAVAQKQYFRIGNYCEIEPEAFTLIGASTKRDDNSKIGFFGSGLKYAMAVLLRNDIEFKVFSGLKEIEVTTEIKNFRGQEFKAICIDGKETSLTTEMGVDWLPWFAVREIYCNALDEGDTNFGITAEVEPVSGATRFYIQMDSKLNTLMNDWNRYFSDRRKDVIAEFDGCKLYPRHMKRDSIIYRKGVQCSEQYGEGLFDYDLDWVKINESRVMASSYDFNSLMPKKLAKSDDKGIVKNILDNINETVVESSMYWSSVGEYSETWLEIIGKRVLIPSEIAGWFIDEYTPAQSLILPSSMVKSLKEHFGDRVQKAGGDSDSNDMELEATPRQMTAITKATDFIKLHDSAFNPVVKVMRFERDNQLGEARNGEVLLSEKVFDEGLRKVVQTIMEEQFHLKSGHGDKTRGFQDFLIGELIRQVERTNEIFL